MACVPQQGTRYTPGTDFINGVSNVDLGRGNDYVATDFWIWPEAYAPIILVCSSMKCPPSHVLTIRRCPPRFGALIPRGR